VSERILVVDDEPAIVDAVSYALRSEGFEVDSRADGEGALEAAVTNGFDLVILDLRLPGLSGIEVCRRLRASSEVPILILSARDAEVDRVLGLESGADDYVTKPFSLVELVSRVRAIFRRRELDRGTGGFAVRTVGGLRVDFIRHHVTVDGRGVGR
jgi:two-component system response regulator RegX3